MKEEVCSQSPERPGLLVEYMHLDLSSLDSVRRFSDTLRERDQSLHVLINNAGISWARHGTYICIFDTNSIVEHLLLSFHSGLTGDGFEQHYQVYI